MVVLDASWSAVQIVDVLLSKLQDERLDSSIAVLQYLEDKLHDAISLVRTGINSHSPINKLPLDIVGLIFEHIPRTLESRVTIWTSSYRETRELLPLTRVCRHWRKAALGFTSLWNSVKSEPLSVSRALSRAGICPLAVYVDRFRPKGSIWNLFISDGHRFKELHLIGLDRIHYAVSDNTSPNFLSFHAPQLEYLRIVHKRGFSTGSPPSTFTLFQGAVSNLRTMVLEDVPWLPANHFPILQRLCIFLTPAVPTQWTLSDLLELLTRCPNLQEIILRGLPAFLELPDHPTMIIAPQHLRKFTIDRLFRNVGTHSYSPLIQWLLSHIVPHEESLVRLHGLTDLDLFTLRGLHLGVLERSTRIRIDTYYNHSFTACGPTSGIKISCQTYPPSTEALASFFSVLRTAHIEELWITPRWKGVIDLASAFAMLPALTTLVLRGDLELDANAFLTALCPPVLLFPNLTTLRIFVNTFALPLSRSLVQVASQRVQHGHPIRHLIIEYNGTPRKGDGTTGATEGVNIPADAVLATLASYIDVVEFLARDRPSSMELPSVFDV